MASDNFRSNDRLAGAPVQDAAGGVAWIQKFLASDSSGNPSGTATSPTVVQQQQNSYTLASNVASLAASASTAPITGIIGGSYVWSYQFGGTSPSLVLESLGPDGVNYQTIATVTASGTQGIVFGVNSQARLRNAGANPITGLSSSIS